MHLYIVINCKTQACRTAQVLMHLGEKGNTPAKVEYWMSYPLMIGCPTCGESFDYSDSEEKFWPKELPPPPDGYSNQLAPPPVPSVFPSEEYCSVHTTLFAIVTCREFAMLSTPRDSRFPVEKMPLPK
jgi:hypothetical protein